MTKFQKITVAALAALLIATAAVAVGGKLNISNTQTIGEEMAAGGGGSKKGGNGTKDNSKDTSKGGGLGAGKDTSNAPGGGVGRSRGGNTGDSDTAKANRDKTGAKDPTAKGRDTSGAQGGGLGRSRGGLTGDSETAKKNRENAGVGDPSKGGGGLGKANPDETGILDSILGYDNIDQRRQAYQNNPNRPNYDTKTMGVPIAELGLTPGALLAGQNVGMSPAASAALNGVASLASGIGPGMAVTRGIQAATGMTGGESVGGFGDGKLGGKNNTRDGKDDKKQGLAAAILGAQRDPEPETPTQTANNSSTTPKSDNFVDGDIDPETGLPKKKVKSNGLPFTYNPPINNLFAA